MRTDLREALRRQLASEAFSYRRIVQASTPALWVFVDWVVWAWAREDYVVIIGLPPRACSYALVILPCCFSLALSLCSKLRVRCSCLALDIMVSLGVVAAGVLTFLIFIVMEQLLWLLFAPRYYIADYVFLLLGAIATWLAYRSRLVC